MYLLFSSVYAAVEDRIIVTVTPNSKPSKPNSEETHPPERPVNLVSGE